MRDLVTRVLPTTLLAGALLVPDVAFALFFNQGFETGTFAGWTESHALNYGLSGPNGCNAPFDTYAISAGGGPQSAIVTAATPETGVDPDLGVGASLKYPKYGQFAARVNGTIPQHYRNTIMQQATVSALDVDPNDSKVHIRFVFALVLERDPPHQDECERPFVHFHVSKLVAGTPYTIASKFIHQGQIGVGAWQVGGSAGELRYIGWQLADVSFDQSVLAPGEDVQLELTGSGCAATVHHGYLYVDAIDSYIPGLTVVKVADDIAVDPGGNLTYTFTYRNDAPAPITNVVVKETIPDCATYVSHTNPTTGGACVYSTTNDEVTCNVGTLATGAIGTFAVTVMASMDVNQCTAIHNDDYSIDGDDGLPTWGPPVSTPIRTCVPPAPTIEAWWPLDEPTGDTAHDIASGFDGTHLGGLLPIPRLTGLVGQSLDFGQNLILVPDPPNGGLDFGPENGMGRDFSIDAWIRPTTAVEGDQRRSIVRKGSEVGYALSQFGNRLSLMMMNQAQGGGVREAISSAIPNLADGEWHLVAATVDRNGGTTGGALVRFYVDGDFYNSVSLAPLPGTIDNDSGLLIGHGETVTDEFLGGIDEVEMFRGVLTPEFIQSVWVARHVGKCKRFCSVPPVMTVCANENQKIVPMSLHNPAPSSMPYTLNGGDLPAGFESGGQTSNVPMSLFSASDFNPQAGSVDPEDVDVSNLTLDTPSGFNTTGDKAAYHVNFTTSALEYRRCVGFLVYNADTCLIPVGTILDAVSVGAPVKKPITISNGTNGPKSYDLEWSVEDNYGKADSTVMSLDTLPPGERLTRTVTVPANSSVVETVTITPLAHDGVRKFDVILRTDLDGDGELQPVASWGFHTIMPPAELMPGRQMSVAPGKVQILAKPEPGSTFALPGPDDDPRVEGGSLQVFDTAGPGSETYALPPGGWTGLGRPAGSKGYRYRGTAADACRLVLVKKKTVKALCRGSAVTLPLPFVGDAGVVLAIGADTQRYCATFGGTSLQNDATGFRSKNAAALDRCSTTSP